jgi:flagellar hook-associated protein 2
MTIGSSIDGLVSGLDTTSLINQLMAAERAPQDRLKAQVTRAQNVIKAYQALNTRLAAVRDAGAALADATGWNVMKGSSSTPTVATVTTGASALSGSLSFTVNRLATAASMVSTGTVPSLSSTITSGSLLVSAGGAALGISSMSGTGLTAGDHTIKVTQASTGASKTGSTAVSGSVLIDATNRDLRVELDGVTVTYSIAAGTYDPGGLADAIETASGGELSASIDGSGQLVLATADEGSAASLRVRSGGSTALTALGFTGSEVNGATSTGTDGIVSVDGTATTVSDVRSGAVVVLPSGGGGSVTATLGSGLRLGSLTAESVSTGDGSLSAVVNAINAANVGVTAAAVQVSPGQYKLQLTSAQTGLAGAVSIDTSAINMGGFASIGAAQDAEITVGTGPGAFTVSSSSNTVKDLLPGVSLNLLTTGSTTVSVTRDADAVAAKVAGLVDKVNAALADIKTLTSYDPETGNSGILMGQFAVRQLQGSLVSALTGAVTTSAIGTAASAGVSITRDGTFTFDKAKFVTAYTADPNGVGALFQRGGTATDPRVSLGTATNKTRPGTYAVEITQAAAQARAAGVDLTGQGGTITNAETIHIRVGGASGTVVSYAAAAGESLTSIASNLNTLLSRGGHSILATVEAGALVLTTSAYGASASFEVRSSDTAGGQTGIAVGAGSFESHAGTNVAGTIDGVAATGTGQLLSAPPTHDVLYGLSLRISATQAEVTAAGGTLALGDFTYVPGVAQRAASAGAYAVDSVSGTITNAVDGRSRQIDDMQEQISAWDRRLALRQATLKRQFAAMETALSSMRQQSNWLAGQVNQLSANSLANR